MDKLTLKVIRRTADWHNHVTVDEGDFMLEYLPQHVEFAQPVISMVHKVFDAYAAMGVPLQHKFAVVLSGVGTANRGGQYHPRSSPPTLQIAPKVYSKASLYPTLIHEIGHYVHDRMVPGGFSSYEVARRARWARAQGREGGGSEIDQLTLRAKALDKLYFRLQEDRYITKPLPRKGKPFEWKTWISGTQYTFTAVVTGRSGKMINLRIIESPSDIKGKYFESLYVPGTPHDDSVQSLSYAGIRPGIDAEIAKVEKERHEIYSKIKAVDSEANKYEVKWNDWLPTNYSKKDAVEWFAEMLTTLLLGHLAADPTRWLLSVIRTGEAPDDMKLDPAT